MFELHFMQYTKDTTKHYLTARRQAPTTKSQRGAYLYSHLLNGRTLTPAPPEMCLSPFSPLFGLSPTLTTLAATEDLSYVIV